MPKFVRSEFDVIKWPSLLIQGRFKVNLKNIENFMTHAKAIRVRIVKAKSQRFSGNVQTGVRGEALGNGAKVALNSKRN